MAVFHLATLTPTKAELIAAWIPTRPWGPSATDAIDVIGAELTVFRRPATGPRPPVGLTATWEEQREPVVLAELRERSDPS